MKENRIRKLIDIVQKASAGDYSFKLDASAHSDEIDLLANEIKQLLEILRIREKDYEQTEAALQSYKQRYWRLNKNIPGMVYLYRMHTDGSFSFPYVNAASHQLFDIDPEDLMRDSTLITRLIHPDDRDRFETSVKYSAETLRPWREELRHIVNGEVRWYDCMSRPELQSDGDVEWDGIILEITDRKRAEEELKKREDFLNNVIDQNPHPIWVSDDKGTLIRINQACCELLCIEADEVKGKYNILKDNLVEEQGHLPLVQSVFEEGKIVYFTLEYDTAQLAQLRLNQTTRVSIEVTISPVRDESGKITNAIIVHNDVTERKRLQEQLLQSRKMQAVGQLAGGVAHDFNNMLAIILGYSELIKSKISADDCNWHNVLEIEKAARHSRDITNQLLAFSRKQVVEPKILDVNCQILRLRKTLSLLLREDIRFTFNPEVNLWKIRFDPSQIDQVIVNLAANARDAMPTGGDLTIETANTEFDDEYCQTHIECTPGQYILLVVRDTGAGMDEETLSRIFEPFFTTKTMGKGTGLGLATVYGIIKQNDGLIYVDSEPGHGTTFKIYIPRVMEKSDLKQEKQEPIPFVRSARILLVEDDVMVRRLTSIMLEKIGHKVEIAETTSDCLSIIEKAEQPIDLLIADVVMPEMSGVELGNKIKAIYPAIKMLFISGYTENIIAHHGISDGEVPLLLKPFTLDDLARKIQEVLESN
jgi:two-component system cell cycle sensor histidine kinase/response regulator CckA